MKSQPIQPSSKAERAPFDSLEDGETLTMPTGKSTFGVNIGCDGREPARDSPCADRAIQMILRCSGTLWGETMA